MNLLDSLFGSGAHESMLGQREHINTEFDSAYNQYAQSAIMNMAQIQVHPYNQQLQGQFHMYRDQPKWMYNGINCTVTEFAELMWPDDPEARLMFVLKHGGA